MKEYKCKECGRIGSCSDWYYEKHLTKPDAFQLCYDCWGIGYGC